MKSSGEPVQKHERRPPSPECMLWISSRQSDILQDWIPEARDATERHSKEHLQPVPEVEEPSETILTVKRNAFPASYLKGKSATRILSKTRSSVACRISFMELARRQNHWMRHCPDVQLESFGVRRPRADRKRDWDMVLALFIGDGPSATRLIPEESWRSCSLRLSCPHLAARTAVDHSTLEFPHRTVVKPHREIVIANVMSNLWFDLEFLSRELEQDAWAEGKAVKEPFFGFALSSDKEGSQNEQHPKQLLPDTCRSLSKTITKPIVRVTSLRRLAYAAASSRVSARTCAGEEIVSLFSSITRNWHGVIKEKVVHDIQVHALLDECRTSQEHSFSSHQIPRQINITTPAESLLAATHTGALEESCFVKDFFCCSTTVEKPVVRRRSVHPSGITPSIIHWLKVAEKDTTCSILHDESPFSSSEERYSFELGIWSRSAEEVLSKSRCKRTRILGSTFGVAKEAFFLCERRQTHSQAQTSETIRNVTFSKDLFSNLQALVRVEEMPSNDSKKFVPKLKHALENRNAVKVQAGLDSVRSMVKTYDPPKRRQNVAGSELIQSIYHRTPHKDVARDKLDGAEKTGNQAQGFADSEESALDLILSDDEVDPQCALGALVQLQNVAGNPKTSGIHARKPGAREGQNAGQPRSPEFQQGKGRQDQMRPTRNDRRIERHSQTSLRAPCDLVISSWSLTLAKLCLSHLTRGTVFLPPPLSALPALSTIIHSHLSETHADNRVVIACLRSAHCIQNVVSFLDLACGSRFSMDVLKRADFSDDSKPASLSQSIARIVVLDSLDFVASTEFRLLVVFGPGTSSLSTVEAPSLSREELRGLSDWAGVPSILIFPQHPYNDIQEYAILANDLSVVLRAERVLFVDERDDVEHSLLLARPDFLFLVPPQEVLHFLSSLESFASCYLPAYRTIALPEEKARSVQAECLRDVRASVIERMLSTDGSNGVARSGDVSGATEALEVLYCLRQTRSYALYDGITTAMDYLTHYAKRTSSAVSSAIEAMLNEAHVHHAAGAHPMSVALKKCIEAMKDEMKNQAPSLRALHRRETFLPLLVTNSKETFNGLLRAIEGAKDISEAGENDVAICELRLVSYRKAEQSTDCEAHFEEQLDRFSHVFHVLDDRNLPNAEATLSPKLLQNVFAGRTRLLTIAVDENRELEFKWQRNENLYRKLGNSLTKGTVRSGPEDAAMLLVQIADVLAAFNDALPPQQRITMCNAENVTEPVGFNRTIPLMSPGAPQQSPNPTVMELSVKDLGELTEEGLRTMCRSRLGSIRGNSIKRLEAHLKVGRKECCTTAVTYLMAALASDDVLRRQVTVRTIF